MKYLLAIVWLILAGWVSYDRIAAPLYNKLHPSIRTSETGETPPAEVSQDLLFVDYVDDDFGFSLVVPQGWTKVVADEPASDAYLSEPGYSVVFESSRENDADVYADYIMVEVLPGIDTGGFESSGKHREVVIIDGQQAVQDKITLSNIPFENTVVDLTVWQAEIAQLGYTVSLYAVGTSNNARMLEDAFRAMVFSLQLPKHLYRVT